MDKCIGCFKPAKNPGACIECKYAEAHHTFTLAKGGLGIDVTEEEEEEIKYELYCALQGMEGEQGEMMERSLLARIIEKCADTAVYLPKKRFVDLDDMKVVLFDLERNAAYMTNADAVIRISGLPVDALDGLRNDLPAYNYIGERFIPNPLPYDISTMDKVFNDTYLFSFTIPVDYLLGNIFHMRPEAISRRNCIAVFDVGYGMYEGSIIIPKFEVNDAGKRFYTPPHGDKLIIPDKSSIIGNDFLDLDAPYVGSVTAVDDKVIRANVYKKFEEYVVFGMYRIIDEIFPDDIHPFNLALYAESDIVKFPLASAIDKFDAKGDKMACYRKFNPVALELEYLYETLVLYRAFGFKFINMYAQSPDHPFLLEGIQESPEQPIIEVVVAPVAVGFDGRICETALAGSGI